MYVAIGYDPETGAIEGLQTFTHPFESEDVDFTAYLTWEADTPPIVRGMIVRDGLLVPAPLTLEGQKIVALKTIIRRVEQSRITWVPKTRGQVEVHMMKEDEGRRYLRDRPNDLAAFPFLEAECAYRGIGPAELSELWLSKGIEARAALARIEQLRFAARADVEKATSVDEVQAVLDRFEAETDIDE